MMANPTTGHLRFSPAEVEAVRVAGAVEAERNLNVTTGSAGQFAIPFDLDPSIILTGTGVANPLRDLATVDTTAVTTWKGVSSDGVVSEPPQIITQKAFASIPVTIEATQDWSNLQPELTRLFADSKNVLEATKFLLGSGTNEPGGILNIGGTGGLTTTPRVQTTTVAVYAVGDPWLLKAAIPPRFLNTSSFVAAPAIWDSHVQIRSSGQHHRAAAVQRWR
jgi:predicted phage gp36 major capsid-like protein